ncbi:hypothetical protein [Amycolatopsis sp. CA-230715]|uniref:hypothetical protein n=1 Tax=Amycolatopsis sp. CA-230715 TaxID=2745196 RepID=UPI001C022746|nr:hypothetical protein [Amycolatopsis sp. CA-230715]QWF85770.1 hypothetical protein HUW46_09250 [Amycolatopsis sp. CA-230715]
MDTVERDLLAGVLVDRIGERGAEDVLVALDEAALDEEHTSDDAASSSDLPLLSSTVDKLTDGDVFSLDDGATWHTCALTGFGTVSVYTGLRRDEEAPTRRIPAHSHQRCLVRMNWTRLYDFSSRCYARIDCPDCKGEGLIQVPITEINQSDTDNYRCVRQATAVPRRSCHVLVQETSVQWADVRARAVNEAYIAAEEAVQTGGGYAETFTARDAIEVWIEPTHTAQR